MQNELRVMAAAQVAAGLVSTHGIDHGGVEAGVVAERALAIADAIIARDTPEPSEMERKVARK